MWESAQRRPKFGCELRAPKESGLALAHRATGRGAFAAGVGAGLHIADGIARLGTRGTDFGALGADMLVMIGLAQHEIGGGNADLRAIHHQLEVFGFDVLAARFEAVIR